MSELRFAKYQGLGNDFIVTDARRSGALMTADRARRLCDRRRGIGGDGVLTILPPVSAGATARMHIYNADGSVPEMCGNGLRCVVHALLEGRPSNEVVVVDTDAGVREGRVLGPNLVRVTLGTAELLVSELEVALGDARRAATAVSMGNPHLVLAPFEAGEDLRGLAERHGAALEREPRFPARINVGFPAIIGPSRIRLVVFERGAGITDACGTGAAAAAVVMRRLGRVPSSGSIRVELPGGPLEVELEGDARGAAALGRVAITGGAERVFEGVTELADRP